MISREDLYLKKLNDNSVVTPQPVTQREKILSELAGANGLGVELPTVTASDNGKTLVVDNGQWALGNASGGGSSSNTKIVLRIDNNNTVVSVKDSPTGDTISTQEIIQLIQNGDTPIFLMEKQSTDGSVYNYTYSSGILSFKFDTNYSITFYVDSISFESTHITLTHVEGDSSGYKSAVIKEINYNI